MKPCNPAFLWKKPHRSKTMTDKCWQKDVPNSKFNVESKLAIKMRPFHLKKTKMVSISGMSGCVAILKIFYFNFIVGYQFSCSYDFGKSESFQRTGYVNHPVYTWEADDFYLRWLTFVSSSIVVVDKSLYLCKMAVKCLSNSFACSTRLRYVSQSANSFNKLSFYCPVT
jgi:hypothetical protein